MFVPVRKELQRACHNNTRRINSFKLRRASDKKQRFFGVSSAICFVVRICVEMRVRYCNASDNMTMGIVLPVCEMNSKNHYAKRRYDFPYFYRTKHGAKVDEIFEKNKCLVIFFYFLLFIKI